MKNKYIIGFSLYFLLVVSALGGKILHKDFADNLITILAFVTICMVFFVGLAFITKIFKN